MMDKGELRKQRIKAHAILDIMLQDPGSYTEDDISKQKSIIQELKNYKQPVQKVYVLRKPVFEPDHSDDTLMQLREDLRAIDLEKNRIANAMSTLPAHINCKTQIGRVKELRKDWMAKKDEIYFYMQHGHLPEVEKQEDEQMPYFELPGDPVELHKALLNARSNLSKAKRKKRSAKSQTSKAHYHKKEVMESNKITAIEEKMASL